MKITRQMKRQIRARIKSSGAVLEKPAKTKRKEYNPDGQRMQKSVTFAFEVGSFVTVVTSRHFRLNDENNSGIIIGDYELGYYEVLINGTIVHIPGKRLRRAD